MTKKSVGCTKETELLNTKTRKFVDCDKEFVDKIRTKPGELPSKQFEARNSLLTDLWEISHIRTIYHICIASLLSLFLHTLAYDYFYSGKVRLGFTLIAKGFAKFHLLIVIWIGMFLASFAIYYGFKFWATVRVQLTAKSLKLKVWDKLWLGLYILFYPCFMYFTTLAVIKNGQPIAASIGLLCEMTRFLMKSHAFVRTNGPRVLKYKLHQTLYPELSQFTYFSFAPTLVYQDSYPRSKQVQWNNVAIYLLEMIASVFFLTFLFERVFIPSFEDYGLKPFTLQDIIVLALGNTVPGILVLLTAFYMILHVWQNMFAEILQFSDRMFYKDWWTSATHERYYRTWNVVVHDWLYTYIYKDFYEIVLPKNKIAAKYAVFFVSAIFHDYILGFACRFYMPILFIQFFGVGVLFTFLKIKQNFIGNIFLWYTTAVGMSITVACYTIEYYSRVNCPIENITVSSYFVPQLFTCIK